ncbi:MAG: hypothetical protein WBC91_17390 [Phototrophicaceae bacterium]
MPTVVERIDVGIYQSSWIGIVKIEEVFDARDQIERLADADHCEKFIIIINGTQAKSIPMDLRMLTQTINKGTIANLVLDAPFAGMLMGRMVNKIMPMQTEFFTDWDKLLERAHALFQGTPS